MWRLGGWRCARGGTQYHEAFVWVALTSHSPPPTEQLLRARRHCSRRRHSYLFGSSSRVTVTKAAPAAASAPAPPKLPGRSSGRAAACRPSTFLVGPRRAASSPASASPGPTRGIGSSNRGGAGGCAAARGSAARPGAAELPPPAAARRARGRSSGCSPPTDLPLLRARERTGIPAEHRAESRLLLGYLPPNKEWREATLQRVGVRGRGAAARDRRLARSSTREISTRSSSTSRTSSTTIPAIFHHESRRPPRAAAPPPSPHPPARLHRWCSGPERVLYIWALRHPASGYAGHQRSRDAVFLVFLTPHLPRDRPAEPEDVAAVAPATSPRWRPTRSGASKLIDSSGPPPCAAGDQRMVFKLKELTARIDAKPAPT